MPLTQPSSLIDWLLEDQRDLTLVSRFAQWHDLPAAHPPRFRDLIPITQPKAGEQYAFEVDLDACSGCKACVTACHALNGLDEEECWREVGQLVSHEAPFLQTVTTACHHCVDPACLNGCPVLAYDKDPLTGIVRHLDDQCIGCQYCVFKCPYDVPKYSPGRGIVRKCDLCHARLAVGEAPACAQACPNAAITITLVRTEDLTARYRPASPGQNAFLPQSPPPDLTLPTTRYVTARQHPPDLNRVGDFTAEPEPAHLPLVWMLTLTQAGVGGFVLLPFMNAVTQPRLGALALAFSLAGLAGSILHLGKPWKAWRAFLNVRRSWLSREIVLFNLFVCLASLNCAALAGLVPSSAALRLLTPGAGLIAVFASGMVYYDTRRPFWQFSIGDFFFTTAILGGALAWLSSTWAGRPLLAAPLAMSAAVLLGMARLAIFLRRHGPIDHNRNDLLRPSALLMSQRLGRLLRARFALGWFGGLLGAIFAGEQQLWAPIAAAVLLLGSELIGRLLFFRAVVPWRMPKATS